MSYFRSPREKRLWIVLFVVVAMIYSTLGLSGALSERFPDQDVMAALFGLAALLAAASVVVMARRYRLRGAEAGIVIGVLAVALMILPRLASPVERSHLVEYAVVGVLVHEALSERFGRGSVRAALVAAVLGSAIGLTDELIQIAIPSRVFDPIDIGFNVGAVIGAVVVGLVLGRARGRRRSG